MDVSSSYGVENGMYTCEKGEMGEKVILFSVLTILKVLARSN